MSPLEHRAFTDEAGDDWLIDFLFIAPQHRDHMALLQNVPSSKDGRLKIKILILKTKDYTGLSPDGHMHASHSRMVTSCPGNTSRGRPSWNR